MGIEEAAEAVGGVLRNTPEATEGPRLSGVSIDTRTIGPGELFFAIEGPRFDGHDFLGRAFEKGASAAVARSGRLPEKPQGPVIEVEDTVKALQRLASHYRDKISATVVAVTGSNGKTTTKDLVAHVLAGTRRVSGTQGNLNNYLGVPLTILTLRPSDEAAVIELGASFKGEISMLARLAKPRIGVITNVGPTHLEQMGSVERVARCKAELAAELDAGGTMIINGDDERLLSEVRRSAGRNTTIVTCGFGPENTVRAVASESLGLDGMEFEVEGWGTARVPTLGRHSVTNALLALAVGRNMGMTFRLMCERLAGFKPPSMRMDCLRLGGILVINDCYNSNPASAGAALETLEEAPAEGRRFAVLGDMLELGEDGPRFHRELGQRASFVERLLVTGGLAGEIARGAVDAGMSPAHADVFSDSAGLIEALLKELRPGDVVLIKGSRGIGLEVVVQALKERFPGGDDPPRSGKRRKAL
jgi:UDP-N-acetylmuramoyl-tripeptide--D-alanyl-D-alanine ligase